MKNFIRILFLFFVSIMAKSAIAQRLTLDIFQNDREGLSSYLPRHNLDKKVINWKKNIGIGKAKEIFFQSLQEFNQGSICGYSLVSLIDAKASMLKIDSKDLFLLLRYENLIDDVVLNTLLKNLQALKYKVRIAEDITIPLLENNQILAFEEVEKNKRRCIDENFKIWKNKLSREKTYSLESLIYAAYHNKIISNSTFHKMYQAEAIKLDEDYVPLRDYISKKQRLRERFPINPNEIHNLTNKKIPQKRIGYRTRLYQKYDFIQIVLLANVIQKLKDQLNSSKVKISVFDQSGENVIQEIELTEMERFRFAIKYLQKEMIEFANNPLVNTVPEFLDLVVAAYEIGIVTTEEVAAIAGLEELWNPKKTFYEKYAAIIRLTGSVGTLLIPPPYGFIVALGLIAIEATAKKSEKITSPQHSLF
jgi:hypothetical protein